MDDDEREFGRYQLFAKLGSGGQADVFLAIARGTLGVDKLVVIKRAKPGVVDDDAQLGDFLDEARFTLRLNHPNVVHTYEVGQEAGTHFLSMEYIEGLSLKELFLRPPSRAFAPAIWLRIIADALSGLSHAHGLRDYDGKPLGIVHRDISPHNILVSYDGVTKLLDFGIAKASASGATTEVGGVTGKAAYMAPEQALGSADRRSDLFAMGVVLWEMLAGRRMFEGDPASILRRLAEDPIPRLRDVLAEVDPELDDLVARALEKDAAARYQSANEMRQALERYLRTAGQNVRELEVGEAISTAFREQRARLQARIQRVMAGAGCDGLPRGELLGLVDGGPALSTGSGPSGAVGEVEPAAPSALGASSAAPPARPPGARSTSQAAAAPRRRARGRAGRRERAGAWALAAGALLGVVALLAWRELRSGGAGRGADQAAEVVGAAGAEAAPLQGLAAAPPSVCATPIRVRVMYDMTGTTKAVGTSAGKGEYDYLRAINDRGGIRGCKLEIDVQDTNYDKHTALEVYAAWKARPDWDEVSTIFVQGTPMTQVLGPLASEDRKVIVSGAYGGELAAPAATSTEVAVPSLSGAFAEASVLMRKQSPGYPDVFFQGTDYTTAARVAATFAWRQGARRMAFFYCSKSPFCTEPVDGAKTFLKALGGTQIGRDLFLELDDDDATTERKVVEFFRQERAYKATHSTYQMVDWIWFGNTSANSPSLARALIKARAQHGVEVHVIGNNWSVDESLYRRCGDACVGFHVVQPFAMFGDLTAAGTAQLLADYERYRAVDGEAPDAHRTVQYVYGRVAVAAWKIAVERLLDRGLPVTGRNLREAFESFRHVDVEGFATIGYSVRDHRPQSGARVARLEAHGRLEMIGQPLSLSLQDLWLGW